VRHPTALQSARRRSRNLVIWAANHGTLHTLRKAASADVQQLVGLITEFRAESPYTLNPAEDLGEMNPIVVGPIEVTGECRAEGHLG